MKPKAHISFTLEIDELAAVVGFLNAKKLVGMDESLFRAFTEENVPNLVAKLRSHGLMEPADRPNTWHFNEDLMQIAAVAVAPQFVALARTLPSRGSVFFYLADDEVTEIVVTGVRAVVASLAGIDGLAEQAVAFLRAGSTGQILIGRVRGERIEPGYSADIGVQGTIHTKPSVIAGHGELLTADHVAAFLRAAIAGLGKI